MDLCLQGKYYSQVNLRNTDKTSTITYLAVLGPHADDHRHLFNPLRFVLLGHPSGSRISDSAEIVVQVFLENSDIPRFESFTPLEHELDSRGRRALCVAHME